jgi:integrase
MTRRDSHRTAAPIPETSVKRKTKHLAEPTPKQMKQRITEQTIKRMKPPDEGYRIEWDSEIRGFGAYITAAGRVRFILNYRFDGRAQRYAIGQYPEWTSTAAREEALVLKTKIQGSKQHHVAPVNPLEERHKDRAEPTLGDLATEYLATDAESWKRPSTRRNNKHMIERIIRPKLGAHRLKAVGKGDIERLHSSLNRQDGERKPTPYLANRVLGLLSAMFYYAIEKEKLTKNPARGIEKFPEDKRERFLTIEEMQKLREAIEAYPDESARDAMLLLMLTGSREGEVLKATWEEFDLVRGVWTKPSHHTKQKKLEHIPLSPPAIKLLQRMRPANPTGPLFLGKEKKNEKETKKEARTTLRRPWVQVCKAAGLVEATTIKGKRRMKTRYRPTLRVHDLRHNFASHLASSGVTLQVVGKLLGHTMTQTTMRYSHLQDEATRAATNVFGRIYTKAGAPKTGT